MGYGVSGLGLSGVRGSGFRDLGPTIIISFKT